MNVYYYDVKSVKIDDDMSRYWGYKVMNNMYGVEVVDAVSECDYVVMRKTYTSNRHEMNVRVCEELKNYGEMSGKQFVYFLHDDPDGDMGECVGGGIIFRTSYLRSMSRVNEYCMPSFYPEDIKMESMDILSGGGISVGFCGAMTHGVRLRACKSLIKNNIKVNIKLRKQIHLGYDGSKRFKINKNEFLDIMRNNVYQLCCRGGGNFSHRFYETLACGRIPVLVDTDIPLPDIGEDWTNYIVMADDVDVLPVKLLEWHNNHDVVDMQVRCRRLWEQRLTFKGFGGTVHNILLNNLKKN
jgi:hypothetical protein